MRSAALVSYTKDNWKRRYSERSDLTTSLVHLTRASQTQKAAELMFKILDEGTLLGSSTSKGFIIGDNPAVCFQDAPVHSVSQNCWFEQKLREVNKQTKKRYIPCGFLFHKQLIYKKGGRPVIYDKTSDAKDYLPESQWWRIVNLDLSNNDSFIDWTHEREWRVKGHLTFKLEDVTLLFPKSETYKKFIEYCDEHKKLFYKKVAGVIVTEHVLF